MQNDHSKLKIHTNVRPVPQMEMDETQTEEKKVSGASEKSQKTDKRWRRRTRPVRVREKKEPLTNGEKLIRNTAVACALLLSVMALKNVDTPWSRQAAEGIRQVVTMRVDWDDTLGKLSFVRALVPDTALVFLNLGQGIDLRRPVQGEIVHEYTEQQPWIEFECEGVQSVCAASGGRVTASGQGAGEEWIVLIEGDDGDESVYGYLSESKVQVGQTIAAGDVIGYANDRVYFEIREDGAPVNPTGRMKP